jgi:hypothetical protein
MRPADAKFRLRSFESVNTAPLLATNPAECSTTTNPLEALLDLNTSGFANLPLILAALLTVLTYEDSPRR